MEKEPRPAGGRAGLHRAIPKMGGAGILSGADPVEYSHTSTMGARLGQGLNGQSAGWSCVSYSLDDLSRLRTRMCFFDETGTLNNENDRFLCLGMVKASHPCRMTAPIQTLRDQRHFYDEMKWNKLSKHNIEACWAAAELLWSKDGFSFHCLVLPKSQLDCEKHFNGDLWKAYESFSVMLVKGTTARNEVVSLLADKIVRPKDHVDFEARLKDRVNADFKRLAVQGVCSVDSTGVELVQVADLLMGAVVYDLKVSSGLIKNPSKYKLDFLNRVKAKVGVADFSADVRSPRFGVHLFQ